MCYFYVLREGIEVAALPDGENDGVRLEKSRVFRVFVESRSKASRVIPQGKAAAAFQTDSSAFGAHAHGSRSPRSMHRDAHAHGFRHIMRKGGQRVLTFQTNHFHACGAQAPGADGRIHGYIAASHHEHATARPDWGKGGFTRTQGTQKIQTGHDAGSLLAGHAGETPLRCPHSEHGGLESLRFQSGQPAVSAYFFGTDEFHSGVLKFADLLFHHLIRKAAGGNAVAQHTARFGHGFEHRRMISRFGKIPRRCKSGRAGTYHGHA